jgi:regulator of replication initiation timing
MADGREYNLISLLLDLATVRINELVEQCDRLKRENEDLREALAEARAS